MSASKLVKHELTSWHSVCMSLTLLFVGCRLTYLEFLPMPRKTQKTKQPHLISDCLSPLIINVYTSFFYDGLSLDFYCWSLGRYVYLTTYRPLTHKFSAENLHMSFFSPTFAEQFKINTL